jgi:hypothetical protein
MALATVTVNGAPALDGVTLAGLTTQLGGAPVPQPKFTELAYPFTDVSVPLKTAAEFTCVVSEGLAMARP